MPTAIVPYLFLVRLHSMHILTTIGRDRFVFLLATHSSPVDTPFVLIIRYSLGEKKLLFVLLICTLPFMVNVLTQVQRSVISVLLILFSVFGT